jgi:hypothetical protein
MHANATHNASTNATLLPSLARYARVLPTMPKGKNDFLFSLK